MTLRQQLAMFTRTTTHIREGLNEPRGQWLKIHPVDSGVLCAACIVKRAAKVKGATVVHAVIEIAYPEPL